MTAAASNKQICSQLIRNVCSFCFIFSLLLIMCSVIVRNIIYAGILAVVIIITKTVNSLLDIIRDIHKINSVTALYVQCC